MGHREMNAPPVRKVVRDADYSWGTSAMMNLYSGTTCPFSHRCRIVLYEKQMDFQVIDVDLFNKPEDIAIINPYNRVPVLVDRDLVLYESNIINEYIDERFPHPQLMPPDPQTRAKARQLLFTMEHELFSYIDALEKNLKSADKSRMHVRDRLTELAPMFNKQKFLLGDDFLHARRGDRPAVVAPRPLRHRTAEDRGAADEVCRAHLLAPGLHRRADTDRKDDAPLKAHSSASAI
jgi:RNA polymerase-associated protein